MAGIVAEFQKQRTDVVFVNTRYEYTARRVTNEPVRRKDAELDPGNINVDSY